MSDIARIDNVDLRDLANRFPRTGKIQAFYLRPQRRAEVQSVEHVLAIATCRLKGDHDASGSAGRVDGGSRQRDPVYCERKQDSRLSVPTPALAASN